jgi:hypothetical protein
MSHLLLSGKLPVYAMDKPFDIIVLNATHTWPRLRQHTCALPAVERKLTRVTTRKALVLGSYSGYWRAESQAGGSAVLGGFRVEDWWWRLSL